MAQYHGIDCNTYSGGVEVTACNERLIKTLLSQGFDIKTKENGDNPCYQISMEGELFGEYFSKLYDDSSNPTKDFAAVMTCAHADENCPFIPGAEQRIPMRYKDPKAFDDTPEEKLPTSINPLKLLQRCIMSSLLSLKIYTLSTCGIFCLT